MLNKKVDCLWTGGFDSTYRIIELSRMDNVVVQPYYLYGDGRISECHERDAMKHILDMLRDDDRTKAIINDVIFIDIHTLEKDDNIEQAYERLHAVTNIGSQYKYLAVFAKNLDNGLELGIEKTPINKTRGCNATIRKYGKLMEINDVSKYQLDCSASSDDLITLLKDFRFPINDLTEEDMLSNIKKWHYENIMKNIWFCHNPIHNKPCGMCNPCAEKMESNMSFLLSSNAQKHYYHLYKLRDKFGNIIGKLYEKFVRRFSI